MSNGFLRKKDLAEALQMAESTVRKFRTGKPVDHAIFVEICQKLNLEWRNFADLGEITEPHRESEEVVIARYSTLKTEKTTPDTLDLAEGEEVIGKPNMQIEESNTEVIEERIFRATEQLNRRGLSALVGIQALEEIAKDSPRYHWKIMELLAAFVRNAPRRKEKESIPDDIQAALTIIGRRNPKKDPANKTLDLSNTDIENALLIEAKLDGAFLIKANLQEANLSEATLQGAFLNKAKLRKAIFLKANLQGANLSEAILQGAFLTRSCLQNANLSRANLQQADLNGANLQQADLSGARLKGAYFGKANLNRAYLIGADLDGVDLSGASLQGAYLYDADLTKAKNLELKEIESAHRDIHTLLPESIAQLAYWKQFS